MKKRKQGVLIILLCIFGVLVVFSGYFYVKIQKQAGVIDDVFYSYCKRAVDQVDIPGSGVQEYLTEKYNISFPEDTHESFNLDFATYKSSWNEYVYDVDPEDPNKDVIIEQRKLEVDKMINSGDVIVSKIRNIIGEPFNKNNVVVVYGSDLENNENLNPEGMNYVGGYYSPELNMIVVSSPGLDLLIHETTHAFDDGAILIESFEEGIADSIEEIVTSQIDNKPIDLWVNDSRWNRPILSSFGGYFRTIENQELVHERYYQSAIKMYERYSVNANFYKIYRSKLLSDSFTQQVLNGNSDEIFIQMIGYNLCAEVTDGGDKNRFVNYLISQDAILRSAEEEIYNDTLSEIKAPENVTKPLIDLTHNGIFDARPISQIYNDIIADTNKNGAITFMSTYKRTQLLDVLVNFYRSVSGDASGSVGIIDELADFFQNVSAKDYGSLQSLSSLLEEPIENAFVTISDSNKNVLYTLSYKTNFSTTMPPSENPWADSPSPDDLDSFCSWCSGNNISSELGDMGDIISGKTDENDFSLAPKMIPSNGFVDSLPKQDIIEAVHRKLPDYRGDIIIALITKKSVVFGERDDECISWPGGKFCWPDKISMLPKSIKQSESKIFTITNRSMGLEGGWNLVEKNNSRISDIIKR